MGSLLGPLCCPCTMHNAYTASAAEPPAPSLLPSLAAPAAASFFSSFLRQLAKELSVASSTFGSVPPMSRQKISQDCQPNLPMPWILCSLRSYATGRRTHAGP